MSWRLSTGLRNALLDAAARVQHAVTNTIAVPNLSFSGDGLGSGGNDQILDSASGLAGFLVGDYITVKNSTNNDGTYQVLVVAAGSLEVAAGELVNESASAIAIIIASALGGSYRGIFRNCVIKIFSNVQGADADTAEGVKICEVTISSGAFVEGAPGNGLNFGNVVAGVLAKASDEIWSGINLSTATAQSFRICSNDDSDTTGVSSTAIRLDGACATSGAQMNLTSTALVVDVTTTIDNVALTMPAD